ncbi:MAG: YeeE/YedE family protein [Dehalococcoidia bacterium]|nr:YeeE/YedE family protein [Dehalococcoidia bacterium]
MTTQVNNIGGTPVNPPTILRTHNLAAISVLISSLALAVYMSGVDPVLAPLWLLGIMAGFTLQRSRFCFASAFRDLFLFGNSKILKGILVGLSISTIGFAINMYGMVPFPNFGVLPSEANILPFGISTIFAGIIFGFGMVISGGCVSGSLYRMAEGYIGSWVSIGGVLIGLGLISQSWNWWWTNFISNEEKIWIPSKLDLGYGGAVVVTLSLLFIVFLFLVWWESRVGLSMPDMKRKEEPNNTFNEKLGSIWNTIFVRGWSPIVGGGILGGIVVLMYLSHMPWGVTGELTRWSNNIMTFMNMAPPDALGLSELGGCAGRADESGFFSHTFAVTVGILPGSFIAALFSREFKLRFPQNRKRYIQALGGGVIMGYGAGLAIGCTVGAFFSAVPSLSLSGWLFAASLAGGSFIGVQAIKRIS